MDEFFLFHRFFFEEKKIEHNSQKTDEGIEDAKEWNVKEQR